MSYLDWILRHLDSKRHLLPAGYVAYLRSQPRFSDGFLNSLPKNAIIIHDARLEEHLAVIGIGEDRLRPLTTGTTDPNFMYIVYSDDGKGRYILNAGLPGGGGIGTQAAELAALGVERIVHVGTCGLMGPDVPSGRVIVSSGAYKDGTAALLSTTVNGDVEPLARPDAALSQEIARLTIAKGVPVSRAVGFTIGSFYFQPESLVASLICNTDLPGPEPVGYVEMEGATLFAVGSRMGIATASVVLGSDRYLLDKGVLLHQYEDFDQDQAEQDVLRTLHTLFTQDSG